MLADYAVGPIHVDADARLLAVPTNRATDGLVTTLVGALGDSGVRVDTLNVRRPSLDDVFLELTGHVAEPDVDDDEEAA